MASHYPKLIQRLQVSRDQFPSKWMLLGVVCMLVVLQVDLYGFTGPLTENLQLHVTGDLTFTPFLICSSHLLGFLPTKEFEQFLKGKLNPL